MLPACRRARPRPGSCVPESGLAFYVVWELREPPRRLSSQSSKMGFQAWLPLPLPKQLVVFGLGDWSCYSADTAIEVDVLVSPGISPQWVGTLEPTRRSLVWEGVWRTDIFMASLKEMDKGNSVKLVLTVNGQLLRGISSSTPTHPFLVPEATESPVLPADDMPCSEDLVCPTMVKSQSSEVTARASRPGRKDIHPPLRTVVVSSELAPPSGKLEPSEAWRKSPVHSKKPRKVLFQPTASERDLGEEDLAVEELQGGPSPRWCHAMCLSDLGTAVLIGGEGADQQSCKDAHWKLEIDSDFWLPMGFQLQKATPSCLRGHTATYDPETKRIYIFGGIREDKDYGGIYILDTVTWKWILVATFSYSTEKQAANFWRAEDFSLPQRHAHPGSGFHGVHTCPSPRRTAFLTLFSCSSGCVGPEGSDQWRLQCQRSPAGCLCLPPGYSVMEHSDPP
ncbi:uncharacterized protein LOC103538798 [Calypte anna]|uniref:uncharacterized protein LOC103538798 n=1 Tax=Calypte anna TaxID=9244 RepID=UPI0011C39411|nr:uncharacterized protein LOC103538798 [Calypte anna]